MPDINSSGQAKSGRAKSGRAQKDAGTTRDAAVRAALALAARDGWNEVTLQAVATEAGIPVAALHDAFADRFDLLAGLGRMVDRAVLARAGAADSALSPRDRLFDLLMERFDVLNEYRDGVTAILDAMKFDPKTIILSMPHLARSMGWMLEAANISTAGWQGGARILGLTTVYLMTARHWASDESEDLSATMAALDKNLGRAEQWAGAFRLD